MEGKANTEDLRQKMQSVFKNLQGQADGADKRLEEKEKVNRQEVADVPLRALFQGKMRPGHDPVFFRYLFTLLGGSWHLGKANISSSPLVDRRLELSRLT